MPRPVVATPNGEIIDVPKFDAAARSGRDVFRLRNTDLIPLPAASRLHFLPDRPALAYAKKAGTPLALDGSLAVAAQLPPGYTPFAHAAFARAPEASELPLFPYTAVCWHEGGFHVPARRVDDDPKHDPESFEQDEIERRVRELRAAQPKNRLIAHHGETCALLYGCPNAQNLFLGRFEAPVAVARACNALCVGCISEQPEGAVASPQDRLGFAPRVDEIVELAVPHLERAPRALISFGQGCEGEPLLEAEKIEAAIRAIRARTKRGTLHLNTNASRPDALEKLAIAGLDSVRASLNSARPDVYTAYYRPRTYGFGEVRESLRRARELGLFTSLNYLSFPGVTDRVDELEALLELGRDTGFRMIQWRTLNIDPDAYVDKIGDRGDSPRLGLPTLFERVRTALPGVRFGYFNPPKEDFHPND